MCAFFSFLFFSSSFFALFSTHSFLCQKRATRVLRFCGRQAQRRGMVEAELLFCWWCIHCVGAVRVKSWQAAPPPAPWLLPAPSCCSKHVLCFMLRTTFGLQLQLQLQLRLLVWVWVRIQVRGFRFRACGLSLLWTETGTGTGPEMETGLCGPGVLPGQPPLRLRFIYGPRLLGNILIPRVGCQLSIPLFISLPLSLSNSALA